MDWIDQVLRFTHITFGFAALTAFWMPILTRKGGSVHVRFGTIFVRCAWVVLASAGLAVLYHTLELAIAGYSPLDQPAHSVADIPDHRIQRKRLHGRRDPPLAIRRGAARRVPLRGP